MSNTSPAAKKYKRLAVAALASALTFLVVAFLQIPFPIGQGGYINIGDAFIFLFATLLPFPYGIDSRRRGCGARNLLGAAVAVVILVVGYYLADAILTGSFVVPLAAAPFNLIQGAVSAALFAGLSYILEKSAFYAGLRDELR